MRIKQATKTGWIEVNDYGAIDIAYPSSKTRRGRVQCGGDVTPAICSQGKDNLIIIIPMDIKKLQLAYDGDKALLYDPETDKYYRLRKLTERECSRLMGNLDKDTDKIEAAGICRSKQYQLYGNSIVVDVLAGIFKNLLCGCEVPEDRLF